MSKIPLVTLKDILTKQGLTATIVSSSEASTSPHIEVSMGKDYKNRNLKTLLVIEPEGVEAKIEWKKNSFLQFFLIFPYKFHDEVLFQLARYLISINKVSAFPGFCLSESDRTIFFKYTLPFSEGHLNQSLIVDFIGLMMLLYDSFSPQIEIISNNIINQT